MKIVFMGTPDFAVPTLDALMSAHQVVAVVTQPDRPKGRGHAVHISPVKARAIEAGIPVLQPETLRDKAMRSKLRSFNADVFVVAAYGLLLPTRVLDMPLRGCLNVHASLLPRYRGAAPMQYALLNGDDATGITIMYMARGMDTGDIILQKELPVLPRERLASLHDRMAALGGDCILDALSRIENGTAERIPQDAEAATYAPMIVKEDGHIRWQNGNVQILNQLRAMDPWPGCFSIFEGQPLKIWDCEPADSGQVEVSGGETEAFSLPGTVLAVDGKRGFMVKTGDGAVWITEVQIGGGKRMRTADYLRGHPVFVGTVLA